MYTSDKKLISTSEYNTLKNPYQLQQVCEEVRASISRELHDNLGQLLTALRIDMCRLAKKTANTELTQLQEIHNDTQQVLMYVDTIIGSYK